MIYLQRGLIDIRTSLLKSLQLAKSIVEFASSKKAENIVILDMRKVANFCDYFVICSGDSDRQVRAIAEGINEGLEKLGIEIKYKQGLKDAYWILLDLGDVVTHIFNEEAREFYGLEYLWQEAQSIPWNKQDRKIYNQF